MLTPHTTPRVMIYSQDGLGLGHLRRTNAIGGALVRAAPGTSVLTVLDSPLGPFFRTGPGQDCVKLPSIVKVAPGVWAPRGLDRPLADVTALRRALLRTAAEAFQPDLLLVDHMPHGALGELRPTLEMLRSRPHPARVVLGLRDIVDAPEVVHRVWTAEGAFAALEESYDAVLVYGRPDVYDAVREYAFPDAVAARTRYAGYVCNPEQGRYTRNVRRRYTGASNRLLVATAGGGADAYPMMRAVLDALAELQRYDSWTGIVVTGPFMPAPLRRELERRARRIKATVRASVSDPLSYLECADVVVAMAGYNSSVEVVRSGTPVVFVPRSGPSAEQRMRTAMFAERGWVGSVEPDGITGSHVAEAVLARLAAPRHLAPPPDGLDNTVRELLRIAGVPPVEPVPVVPTQLVRAEDTLPDSSRAS